MTNATELQAVAEPTSGPRPIAEIIAYLSRPVNPQRLKQRQQGGRTLDYLPWYQAIRHLDKFAVGWRYEIRSVNQVGDNLVMTVRITIPCAEGDVWRGVGEIVGRRTPQTRSRVTSPAFVSARKIISGV
jgi:hypothetical protein